MMFTLSSALMVVTCAQGYSLMRANGSYIEMPPCHKPCALKFKFTACKDACSICSFVLQPVDNDPKYWANYKSCAMTSCKSRQLQCMKEEDGGCVGYTYGPITPEYMYIHRLYYECLLTWAKPCNLSVVAHVGGPEAGGRFMSESRMKFEMEDHADSRKWAKRQTHDDYGLFEDFALEMEDARLLSEGFLSDEEIQSIVKNAEEEMDERKSSEKRRTGHTFPEGASLITRTLLRYWKPVCEVPLLKDRFKPDKFGRKGCWTKTCEKEKKGDAAIAEPTIRTACNYKPSDRADYTVREEFEALQMTGLWLNLYPEDYDENPRAGWSS